jgi:hypothetical protein
VVTLHTEDPLAVAVVEAILTGDVPVLKRPLAENPALACVVRFRAGDRSYRAGSDAEPKPHRWSLTDLAAECGTHSGTKADGRLLARRSYILTPAPCTQRPLREGDRRDR